MLLHFRLGGVVFGDRLFDTRQRFLACLALRIAPRQIVAPDGKTLFGFNKRDAVFQPRIILLIPCRVQFA